MSIAYAGNYEISMYNAAKRYKMHFQKGVPLSSNELDELQDVSDSYIRQLISANFPTIRDPSARGCSINNGFKIVESSTNNTNNFTISGGDGTVDGAGVLFVDGYILFLKGDIEYNEQDSSGGLTDDNYTKSNISGLTTPLASRTDEVYIDFYFAEVSSSGTGVGTAPPEYLDPSLTAAGIGFTTANRVRMVQDIKIAEGPDTTPIDGIDSNGILHRYIKIATITRDTSSTISDSMINDERILVNSIGSLSTGNTITNLVLADGTDIGDDLHRIGTIFLASELDFSSDLMFSSSGSEKVRFTTSGDVGVGTVTPQTKFHVYNGNVTLQNSNPHLEFFNGATYDGYIGNDSVLGLDISAQGAGQIRFHTNGSQIASIGSSGLGIGTSIALYPLHVIGDCYIQNNLTVVGNSNYSDINIDGKLEVTQDSNDNSIVVNQTNTTNPETPIVINNAGVGSSLDVLGSWPSGESTIKVQSLSSGVDDVSGLGCYDYLGTRKFFINYDSTIGAQIYSESGTLLSINGDKSANVGIGTNNPLSFFHIDHANSSMRIQGTYPKIEFYDNLYRGYIEGNGDSGNAGISLCADGSAGVVRFLTGSSHVERMRIAESEGNASVGIGTQEPQAMFHVNGSSLFSQNVVTDGNIGIGTNDPQNRLQIVGDANISTNVSIGQNCLVDGNIGIGTNDPQDRLQIVGDANISTNVSIGQNCLVDGNIGIGTNDPQNKLQIVGDANISTNLSVDGNVGIGTNEPLYALHVVGDAHIDTLGGGITMTGQGGLYDSISTLGEKLTIQAYKPDQLYETKIEIENQYNGIVMASGDDFVKVNYSTISLHAPEILCVGNVGVGTVSPLYDLHVVGTAHLDTLGGGISMIGWYGSIDKISTQGTTLIIQPDDLTLGNSDSKIEMSTYGGTIDLSTGNNYISIIGDQSTNSIHFNAPEVFCEGALKVVPPGQDGIVFIKDDYCRVCVGSDPTGTWNYGVLNLAGGRYGASSYGAYVNLRGNDAGGQLSMFCGDALGASIALLNGPTYIQQNLSVGQSVEDVYYLTYLSRSNFLQCDRVTNDGVISICHGTSSYSPDNSFGSTIESRGAGAGSLPGLLRLAAGTTGKVQIDSYDDMIINAHGYEIGFFNGGAKVAKISATGQIYSDAGTTIISPASDFAEWTKVEGSIDDYTVGTIVQQSLVEDMVVQVADDPKIVYGVVTDRATFCGGLPVSEINPEKVKEDFKELTIFELEEKYNAKRIAMTGHVLCKVFGIINRGDRLTASAIKGVAKSATSISEEVNSFAIARQNYGSEEIGLIEVRL